MVSVLGFFFEMICGRWICCDVFMRADACSMNYSLHTHTYIDLYIYRLAMVVLRLSVFSFICAISVILWTSFRIITISDIYRLNKYMMCEFVLLSTYLLRKMPNDENTTDMFEVFNTSNHTFISENSLYIVFRLL